MRRRFRGALVTLTVTGALLGAAPGAAHAAASPGTHAAACPGDGVWTTNTFPEGNANLVDVTQADADTAWAVGSRRYGDGRDISTTPLAFTRDDASPDWHEIALPDGLGARTVDSDHAGGVWVTGTSGGTDGIPTGRHDATGWHVQQAPAPAGSLNAGFGGLAAAGGPHDVWGVGTFQPGDILTFYGLIEHWNGSVWQQVPSPVLDTDYWTLSDVAAIAPDDVWAVGALGIPEEGRTRPLVLHYDGRSWTRVRVAAFDATYGELVKVVAAGPSGVWVAGTAQTGTARQNTPLVAHFAGTTWKTVNTGLPAGSLTGITAVPGGVAVVGVGGTTAALQPIGARLTRSGWKPFDLPAGTAARGRAPRGIVSTPTGTLTVVGYDDPGTTTPAGAASPVQPFALTRT